MYGSTLGVLERHQTTDAHVGVWKHARRFLEDEPTLTTDGRRGPSVGAQVPTFAFRSLLRLCGMCTARARGFG